MNEVNQSSSDDEEDKAERILQAASEIILSPDFHSLSTNEVAERANVSKGLIFHHYGSKDNLILKVITRMLNQQLRDTADHVDSYEDPLDVLKEYTQLQLKLISDQSHIITLVMQLIGRMHKDKQTELTVLMMEFAEEAIFTLRKLFLELGWSEESVMTAVQMYLAILDGLGMQNEFFNYLPQAPSDFRYNPDDILEFVVDLFDKR